MVLLNHYNAFVKDCVYKSLRDKTLDGLHGRTYGTCTLYLQSVTCVIFSDILWPGLPTISYLCYIFRYPMTWFTYNQLPVLYFQISYDLGTFFFYQEAYHHALEMFGETKDLMKQVCLDVYSPAQAKKFS